MTLGSGETATARVYSVSINFHRRELAFVSFVRPDTGSRGGDPWYVLFVYNSGRHADFLEELEVIVKSIKLTPPSLPTTVGQ